MKSISSWLAIPAAIALSLTSVGAALAQTVTLNPGFKPDPTVLTGTSGGSTASACGNITATPSQTVKLSQAMDLMFTVQGNSSLTLLIKAPGGGQFCVMSDGSGAPLQQPGYWNAGTYEVYVGDRAASGHAYQLSIASN